ncbi:helix-turn-helix domain-containing protein [Mycobacterium sp. M1]|uniref:Helix-turn-helix domain-containing protein n=1 Tax=Mycolicibacter acidiphilus TaxID=2835306 RepID=A0ABS5RCR9_9MYCO|nr:helix-turn-helix domain-containing protein [Mycolicibacter acidiphilus]MBS9532080.1 helix-turn-helix domain-containing protein [Mycolicibacter acidiphilus]
MSAKKSITPQYVGLTDAAAYSGYSVFTLREKVASGELPAYRISDKPGSRIKVKLSDIDALMKPVIPAEIAASKAVLA